MVDRAQRSFQIYLPWWNYSARFTAFRCDFESITMSVCDSSCGVVALTETPDMIINWPEET